MALHLVVPGLLWPQDSLREVVSDLALPALSTLLGRGERRFSAPGNLLAWLGDTFRLPGGEKPWGSLRRAGEADGASEGTWICADPVHIRFARDAMVVTDAGELAIAMDEAEELVAALNAHFPDIGQFVAQTPERWYLRVNRAPDIRTHDLYHVIGRNFPLFLPEGPEALRWRALLNETQMLLHAHPRNAEREAAGRPVVNSLWFWGAAALPAAAGSRYRAVLSNDPAAIGLSRSAGIAAAPLPIHAGAALNPPGGGDLLVILDGLAWPTLRGDAGAWREILVRLEQQWFAPLLEAVYAGELAELRIAVPGDRGSLELTLTPKDRWKLWRRPMALCNLELDPGPAGKA
jgi:hypothetical protein